jgi:hypothetical protein
MTGLIDLDASVTVEEPESGFYVGDRSTPVDIENLANRAAGSRSPLPSVFFVAGTRDGDDEGDVSEGSTLFIRHQRLLWIR